MNTNIHCIDSHAHLTSDTVFGDVEAVLNRAQAVGVAAVVNICTNVNELERGIELSKRFPWVFNAAATTPHDVEKQGEAEFGFIAEAARRGQLVAVGETGLDYYYEHSAIDIQKLFLHRYLLLALECRLPIIIHCREAFADFFSILDDEYKVEGKHAAGVLHCFTGTVYEAHQVLERGWYLSLSGIITFKKSTDLQDVAKMVPLSQLLIETDTPYLAPQSHRGKPNEPAYVLETAAFIAKLKGISVEAVIESSANNARSLFKF